eukprot:1804140-Alexandrium_andersonii.AAC.1
MVKGSYGWDVGSEPYDAGMTVNELINKGGDSAYLISNEVSMDIMDNGDEQYIDFGHSEFIDYPIVQNMEESEKKKEEVTDFEEMDGTVTVARRMRAL